MPGTKVRDLQASVFVGKLSAFNRGNSELLCRLTSTTAVWISVALLIVSGALALVAWVGGLNATHTVFWRSTQMSPATAVSFVLMGIAIGWRQSAIRSLQKPSYLCAALVAGAALLQIALSLVSTTASGWLAAESSLLESVSCGLISVALLFLASRLEPMIIGGQLLALVCATSSFLVVLGYVYGVPALYNFGTRPAALLTSITFLAASCGVLALRSRSGLLTFVTDRSIGGLMARRLLPVVALVPTGLGALWLSGERQGLFQSGVGVALFVVAQMMILAMIVGRVAQLLGSMEREAQETADLLEKDREFLRVVVETVREGIVACDAHGVLTLFNDVTRRLHGLPKRAVPPERWAEHYDMFQADGVTRLCMEEVPLFRALQGDAVREMEFVIAPKNMPQRRIIASGQPMFSKEGGKLGAVVVLHDITARKKADDALRQSEQRLRTVVSSAPVVMWSVDHAGIFTFSDGSALPVLRLGAGSAVGQSVFEVFSHNPEICAHFRRALTGAEVNAVIDTHGVVFEMRLSPMRDRTDAVTGVIGVANDITQRRRAEEALRQSHSQLEARIATRTAELTDANQRLHMEMADRERAQVARRQIEERLQAIIDNAPAVICVKDLAGNYLLVNRMFEQLAGLSRDQISGKTDFEVFPIEQAEKYAASDQRVRQAGAPVQLEETVLREDGLHTYFTIKFPLCGPDGKAYAICDIATNITDRKRADERLRQSEERFSLLVEGVQDYGIYMLDPNGHVASWNRGAQRLSGYDAEEIIGQHFSCFYPPENVAAGEIHRGLMEAASTGRLEREGWRIRKDGSRFLANVVITAVRDSSGRLCGFAKVTRDITELRKAEEDLVRAKEEAERANEAKSEFLSRMSHEFRTPLNAILGFGQLLEMDGLEGDQGSGVQQILRAGEHLLALVNEVLDISQIESGEAEFALEPIGLVDPVQDAAALVKNHAESRSITLNVELDPSGPLLFADRQRLKQILINLLSNAVKYNRDGGTVTVSSEIMPQSRFAIHVRDTGFGIPAEKMQRLFTPFDRLEAEQRGIDGTGIGLTLSRWLAQGMGGTLIARSVEGEGCTFTLTLPVAEGTATLCDELQLLGGGDGHGRADVGNRNG